MIDEEFLALGASVLGRVTIGDLQIEHAPRCDDCERLVHERYRIGRMLDHLVERDHIEPPVNSGAIEEPMNGIESEVVPQMGRRERIGIERRACPSE